MGYVIHYGKQEKRQFGRMTTVAFLIFLLLVCTCWPRGRSILMGLLLPGDRETTLQALALLSGELKSGAGVMEALETFCGCIFAHALAAG